MVKGKTVGIDATTLEANEVLRSIVRRDSGESDGDFLTKLAQASGIETPNGPISSLGCPHHCLCVAPKQRLQGQRQPTHSIVEVKEGEGLSARIPSVRQALSYGETCCRQDCP